MCVSKFACPEECEFSTGSSGVSTDGRNLKYVSTSKNRDRDHQSSAGSPQPKYRKVRAQGSRLNGGLKVHPDWRNGRESRRP